MSLMASVAHCPPNAWPMAQLPLKAIDLDDQHYQELTKAWTSRLNTPGFVTFIPCDAPAMVCLSAQSIQLESFSTLLRNIRGLFCPSISNALHFTSLPPSHEYAGKGSRNCFGSVAALSIAIVRKLGGLLRQKLGMLTESTKSSTPASIAPLSIKSATLPRRALVAR